MTRVRTWLARLGTLTRRLQSAGVMAILTAGIRGLAVATYYRVFKRGVVILLPFFAYERVTIVGPGRVTIGRFCSVWPNAFRGLAVVTLANGANVDIGDGCDLGGVRIYCRSSVRIGARTLAANCLIQDTATWDEAPATSSGIRDAPIDIGANAWLGAGSCILAGTSIGRDSVVSWGALCCDINVPDGSLACGNPVVRPVSIARVASVMRRTDEAMAGKVSRPLV
jgi:acetyltransferase-like isoleucine patch superfamily enzyme